MATVSLFWDINIAAVTSCENNLYCFKPLTIQKEKKLPLSREFSLHFNKGEYRIVYLFIYYLFF